MVMLAGAGGVAGLARLAMFLQGQGHVRLATLPRLCPGVPSHHPACRGAAVGQNGKILHRVALCAALTQQGRMLAPYHTDLSGNMRTFSDLNGTSTKMSQVEISLEELRMKLERLGSLKLNDINQAVKALEQCLEELSDADCLQLLQFCSKMTEEEYRPCGSLIHRVWRLTTDRPNGNVNEEHLELYLRLCLSVESTSISERDIFEQLEKHSIEPSAKVFEVLMMALGQRGHLDGALRVLTRMKDRGVAVREATFAALILAYGAENDWESVEGVLDTMRSVQMSQSEVTFGALAIVCSAQGQVLRVRQVVTQAWQRGVALSSTQLEAVLFALIRNGHAGDSYENIDFVLQLVEESGMKADISWLALHLIHCGRVKEAVHLVLSLPFLRTNNHLYSNAAIYLREIVHTRTAPSVVVDVCRRLQEEGINQFSLQVALEQALRERWEELAWVLLRAMKDAGLPLREHYFWPLLHLKAIAQEPVQLLECVQLMLQLAVTPSLVTLRDHVIPGLSLSQPCLTLQMLQNTGLSATAAATPLLIVLVKNNMMEQAISFVQKTKVPISVGDTLGTLAPAWHSHPKSIISLLALLMHHGREPSSKNMDDWGGQFLLSLAATRAGLAVHLIRPLFQELKKHGIGVSEDSADLLVNQLNQPLQKEVKDNLSLVLQPAVEQPSQQSISEQLNQQHYSTLPHPRNMKESELEGHLEELRAKGLNTRGSLRRLLLLRASRNDTAGVLELMRSACKDKQQLSAGMLSSVLMAYINNGNAEAAMDIYSLLGTKYPSFKVDSYKVVDLCTLLIQSGRAAEASEILLEYFIKSDGKSVNTRQILRNCRNLLLASASTSNPQETDKLFSLLLQGGLVEADTVTLGVLVKSRLNRGDLAGAIETARKMQQQYSRLPMRRELLIHLINHHHGNKETESVASYQLLQDMMEVIADVKGLLLAQHDLLFAYLEAGQPAEARTVLRNLARSLDHRQLTRQLQYYVKTENEEAVLHLLTASRGMPNADRQAMYECLLNIYHVKSEGEKGLSLWTSMQEEGLTPTPSFLTNLAALLAVCKIKIPFQI
ncbi:leucine-rich PPR motif-containing protein, mitochondrial-like isoform X2 [Portunus trituberculatus]|uniref:leucine-rich PPR motif-containing protein, mitochondrial-like isoform X2 n=1 Tax=Portunus trituberculatus TaxID=210409 RepID=UPI001E1CEB59|nr:leucine-rich PPR motif-containing protein, mitochondrial-like isoform X2 [Portunus trituberculatus]